MTIHEAYAILELNDGDSLEEIKKSYRRLALKYHPDRNRESKDAEEKFKQINDAYEYLLEYKEETEGLTAQQEREAESDPTFAYHHNYHERYKCGEFGEYEFKKRA